MNYIKKFSLFENNLINIDEWEDLKDLIQLDIMDKWNISNELVEEFSSGKSGDKLLEPSLRIYINERMNNDEPKEIIADVRKLHKRVFGLLGKYISVEWSSQAIFVYLNDIPNHYTILEDFNLEIDNKHDNVFDRKSGGICTYEQALEIMAYLNKFYRFAYDSDIRYFTEAYQILNSLYEVQIEFSLPRFRKELYRQVICFEFKLKSKVEKVIGRYFPVFTINTNHTESPQIIKRASNSSWAQIKYDKQKDFLENEQF
jgi:hypothetical protein